MASPSSRRKSASKSSPELLDKLLADGTQSRPSAELRAAADDLVKRGIIALDERQYVRCANAEDTEDFRYVRNRNCRGRVYLEDGLDLYGDDYKCPDCDRTIYPGKKKRYEEWRVRLLPNGVKAFVESALKDAGLTWTEKAPWVLRVDVGEEEVWLCIVDFCESCQHMTREWAVANHNKALWLVVHPRGKTERFLQEDWIPVVSLSELLTGNASLNSLLQARAACNPVTNLGNPSLPIYTKGRRHPATFETEMPPNPDRLFVVRVGDREVFVNSYRVVARQSSTAFAIFNILHKRFLARFADDANDEDATAIPAKDLCSLLYDATGGEPASEESLGKAIGRIRQNIEKVIKKNTGMPIDECDVIETVRWKGIGEGEYGYRLNPVSVAIRPFVPTKPET
ncbi:hypothetical protein KQH29_00715 [bacterium]|nr:hypothetical protein [bacterium]